MDSFSTYGSFEDLSYLSKVVVYVNPRQYDRIIRRRMERDRLMDRRGKPRPIYVPIAIRELSFKFIPSDNFYLGLENRKNNYVHHTVPNSLTNGSSNNINIYINNPITNNPINTNINNGLNGNCLNSNMSNGLGSNINGSAINNQMFSNLFNTCNMYNGYNGTFAKGSESDNSMNYGSIRPKTENYSYNRSNKYNNYNQGPYQNGYYSNNTNYYPKDFQMERELSTKFDSFSVQNSDFISGLEGFISSAPYPNSNSPNLYNLNNPISSLYISNNASGIGTITNVFNGCINSNFNGNPTYNGFDTETYNGGTSCNSNNTNSTTALSSVPQTSVGSRTGSTIDRESIRDSSSVGSLNSREEIKNNYLHLNNSPYSDSSIDSEIIARTDQIYNINHQGIVIDINPDLSNGINQYLNNGLIGNIEGVILDNFQDFNYIANSDLLKDTDTSYSKSNNSSKNNMNCFKNQISIKQEINLNSINGVNGRSIEAINRLDSESLGSDQEREIGNKNKIKHESSLYRQLYSCFSQD